LLFKKSPSLRCSVSLVEGDGVVVAVELGGVWAHEDIADDDVLEVVGEVSSHDSHDALGLGHDGLLEDVVVGGQDVVCGVEGEGDVGQAVQVGAVLLNGDALEERLEEGVWSHDEGGARVNGGLVTGDIDVTVGAGHLGEVEVPVGLLDDVVLGNLLEAGLFIDTWHGHVGSIWVVLHVEGEGALGEAGGFLDEGWELVNGDLVVSETDDTVHLGDEEGLSVNLLDLTEAHLGLDISVDSSDIAGDETIDGARAVGDVEGLTVFLVSIGLAGVVLGVGHAGDGVALAGVDPEVGGASVWNDGELLVVGTDRDVNEVLSVHVVLDGNVLTGGRVVGGAALPRLLLLDVVVEGEWVVLEGDSGGLNGGAKKSSNERVGVHNELDRFCF